MSGAARFATVVLDVDSTLTAIEGIDWLAARRGPDVAARVAAATERSMRGEIPIESVYGERLAVVRPSRAEIAALGDAYAAACVPGAADAVVALQRAGVEIVVVSGGFRAAILTLTRSLGIPDRDVHAVALRFDAAGAYAGFDEQAPPARSGGKPVLVRSLALPRPIVAMGDGASDAELRGGDTPAADAFVAFTGVATRPAVVRAADHVVDRFDQLVSLVLG